METLTQPSPGITSSSNLIPQDPSQADPGVIKVMQAIKNVETPGSKDPYTAVGDNGDSHGAYQFNKDNYKNWATQYGIDPNDFSSTAQNKVAYARIKDLKNQGLDPEEIAAKWNGAKVDSSTGKLTYVNPEYGVKFRAALQQGKNSNTQTVQSPDSSQSSNPLGAESALASSGVPTQDNESALGKLIDFAFPILSDIQGKHPEKSLLQKAGDLGQSALWFVPGVGEGAEAAIKGAGLLGDAGAKIAGQAIGGATQGYASDVASKLSSGDTNAADVLTPGVGTVTGGILGGSVGKLGNKFSKEGIVNDAAKSNNAVLGQTKRGANELAESFAEGKDTGKFLATKGIHLPAEVNPETVAYDTAGHAQNIRNDVGTLNTTLSDALKVVPGGSKITDIEDELENKIRNQALDKVTADEQVQIMKDETAKWRSQYGEDLSVADLNDLKKRNWDLSKFDATKTNATMKTHRAIGNVLKTSVEDIASKGGLDGVKEMNEYMAQHLDAADALERVHGTKAKGGRLGDLLQKHTMGALGGGIGLFGGGPVGAIMGAMAGEYAGGKLASAIRRISASPIRTAMLKRMVQEDPAIIQKMIEYSKSTPQGLAVLKKQLSSMGIDIFKGSAQKTKVAPKPGLLSRAAKKTAKGLIVGGGSRIGSQFNFQNPKP